MNWLLVFLGGGAGSLVRYALARGLSTAASSPVAAAGATLLANALASTFKASGQFPLLIQWANSALQVEKVLSPPQNPMAKAA